MIPGVMADKPCLKLPVLQNRVQEGAGPHTFAYRAGTRGSFPWVYCGLGM